MPTSTSPTKRIIMVLKALRLMPAAVAVLLIISAVIPTSGIRQQFSTGQAVSSARVVNAHTELMANQLRPPAQCRNAANNDFVGRYGDVRFPDGSIGLTVDTAFIVLQASCRYRHVNSGDFVVEFDYDGVASATPCQSFAPPKLVPIVPWKLRYNCTAPRVR